MTRECHVRFCEGLAVKVRRPTHPYIKVEKGYVYLAVIMDLFSRKIIGWSLDTTMTNQLIIDALNMALKSRDVEPGLILHSDRGVQYRSGEYQQLLLGEGIRPSMSRKGNCSATAPALLYLLHPCSRGTMPRWKHS